MFDERYTIIDGQHRYISEHAVIHLSTKLSQWQYFYVQYKPKHILYMLMPRCGIANHMNFPWSTNTCNSSIYTIATVKIPQYTNVHRFADTLATVKSALQAVCSHAGTCLCTQRLVTIIAGNVNSILGYQLQWQAAKLGPHRSYAFNSMLSMIICSVYQCTSCQVHVQASISYIIMYMLRTDIRLRPF